MRGGVEDVDGRFATAATTGNNILSCRRGGERGSGRPTERSRAVSGTDKLLFVEQPLDYDKLRPLGLHRESGWCDEAVSRLYKESRGRKRAQKWRALRR